MTGGARVAGLLARCRVVQGPPIPGRGLTTDILPTAAPAGPSTVLPRGWRVHRVDHAEARAQYRPIADGTFGRDFGDQRRGFLDLRRSPALPGSPPRPEGARVQRRRVPRRSYRRCRSVRTGSASGCLGSGGGVRRHDLRHVGAAQGAHSAGQRGQASTRRPFLRGSTLPSEARRKSPLTSRRADCLSHLGASGDLAHL